MPVCAPMARIRKKQAARRAKKTNKVPKKKKPPLRRSAPAGKKQARPHAPSAKRSAKGPSRDFDGVPLRQIAARLRAHLVAHGLDPVLTGRACASIYAGGNIKPRTLEFVLAEYSVGELEDAMRELGFRADGGSAYASKRCPVDVVFMPPPLSVGDDVVQSTSLVRSAGGEVRLLTPTDCVRERLSMYYQWGDREAFQDAVDVARNHPITFDIVKSWSDHEWYADRYAEFLSALEETSS